MLSATMHNLKGKAKHSITIHNPLPVPGGSPVQVGSVFINHHRFSFLIKKKNHHRFWQGMPCGQGIQRNDRKGQTFQFQFQYTPPLGWAYNF